MAFSYIENNILHTRITQNTSTASTNGYIGRIQLTCDAGYQFKPNNVSDYTLIAGQAYVNGSSTATLNAALPNTLKTNYGVVFLFQFTRTAFQVAYTSTRIQISGEVEPISSLTFTNNIANTAENHSISGDDITVNVVGSITNYRFDGAPTITYTDTNNVQKTVNCTVSVSQGISTATATISDANLTQNTFIINGTYAAYVEVVNNIDDVNLTYSVLSTDLTINLAGTKNGYQFTSQPLISYTDTNGNSATAYMTLTDGNTKANKTLIDCDMTQTVTVNGDYQLVITAVNNIADTALSYTYDDNTEILRFVVVGNITNYRFIGTPTITYTDINGIVKTVNMTVELVGESSAATVAINDADLSETFTANGTYDKIIPITVTASNCTVNVVDGYVYRDTMATITATANEYCKFTVAPRINIYKTVLFTHIDFIISANEKTATAVLDMTNYVNDYDDLTAVKVDAAAIVDTAYSEKYGAINVYVVTNDDLTQFARKRFFTSTSGNAPLEVDLGNFVPTLKRLYISNIAPLVNNVLRCGNYNTEINVITPINDIFTLNCGTVTIPTPNNNITDLNAEISLFLPFVGFVDLAANFVGKTISVEYICNIVTANAVVNVKYDSVIIAQYECTISSDLYYRTAQTEKTAKAYGKLDFNNNVLKGLTPFVLFKWYNDANEKIINADCVRGVLSAFSGYVECIEVENLSAVLPSQIRDLIITELENGVYL